MLVLTLLKSYLSFKSHSSPTSFQKPMQMISMVDSPLNSCHRLTQDLYDLYVNANY